MCRVILQEPRGSRKQHQIGRSILDGLLEFEGSGNDE